MRPKLVNVPLGFANAVRRVPIGLGLLAAYALARLPVPGKSLILLGIVAGRAFPQIATVSPLYLLMRALGLVSTQAPGAPTSRTRSATVAAGTQPAASVIARSPPPSRGPRSMASCRG